MPSETPDSERPLRHILILTDRDWTHPQGGGTGTNLFGHVARWVAWGHRVTVVAGSYPGAPAVERPAPNLEIHRMGSRLTVFPRAAWAVQRGLGRDADVVLEVVNGIAFFTPFWAWLRAPRVTLVQHVHRGMYVAELGRRGAFAAWLLETLPLRHLYRGVGVVTISQAARADLERLGVDRERIRVVYCGVEDAAFHTGPRSPQPTLLYLGRLKRYKRLEVLLDLLEAAPQARLEVAGEGDHREAFEAEVAARGLAGRVVMHGFVTEERKRELLASAWVNVTASSAEGWCLTVMEAGACGTPSAALEVGGLGESIVDGETGVLAGEPDELAREVAALLDDAARRETLGRGALERARHFSWDRTATGTLDGLEGAIEAARERPAVGRGTALVAGLAVLANAAMLVFLAALARMLGLAEFGDLAALVSALLVVAIPAAALQVGVARRAVEVPRAALRALVRTQSTRVALAGAGLTAAAVVARAPLADALGVSSQWAAAALPAAGALCALLGLQRGALQGLGAHRSVAASIAGEAALRIAAGLVLVAAGLGVAGAFGALVVALAVCALAGGLDLRRRLSGAAHAEAASLPGGAVAVAGLALLAVLVNVDVLLAVHITGAGAAGAYAAAAVLAKGVLWTLAGPALYVLPAAARRAREGRDPRPLLAAVALPIGVLALCVAAVALLAGEPLLGLLFGDEFRAGAEALPWLVAAAALFALALIAGAHHLAAGDPRALAVLVVAVAAEAVLPIALAGDPQALAAVLAGIAACAAAGLVVLGPRGRHAAA